MLYGALLPVMRVVAFLALMAILVAGTGLILYAPRALGG